MTFRAPGLFSSTVNTLAGSGQMFTSPLKYYASFCGFLSTVIGPSYFVHMTTYVLSTGLESKKSEADGTLSALNVSRREIIAECKGEIEVSNNVYLCVIS